MTNWGAGNPPSIVKYSGKNREAELTKSDSDCLQWLTVPAAHDSHHEPKARTARRAGTVACGKSISAMRRPVAFVSYRSDGSSLRNFHFLVYEPRSQCVDPLEKRMRGEVRESVFGPPSDPPRSCRATTLPCRCSWMMSRNSLDRTSHEGEGSRRAPRSPLPPRIVCLRARSYWAGANKLVSSPNTWTMES